MFVKSLYNWITFLVHVYGEQTDISICSPIFCNTSVAFLWVSQWGKIGWENFKISDASDFNSFLKLVLVSYNENCHEQASNAVLTFPFIKFLDPCVPRWQWHLRGFGPENTLIQGFLLELMSWSSVCDPGLIICLFCTSQVSRLHQRQWSGRNENNEEPLWAVFTGHPKQLHSFKR